MLLVLPPPAEYSTNSHPPGLLGCLPVSRHTTLCLNLLRARSIRGVSTHVSALNINTSYTTALKISLIPLGPPPPDSKSLTSAPNSFLPSAGCLPLPASCHPLPSSPAVITLPRYVNAFTFNIIHKVVNVFF